MNRLAAAGLAALLAVPVLPAAGATAPPGAKPAGAASQPKAPAKAKAKPQGKAAARPPAKKPEPRLPFVEGDYARALADARARNVPLVVDVWAPW